MQEAAIPHGSRGTWARLTPSNVVNPIVSGRPSLDGPSSSSSSSSASYGSATAGAGRSGIGRLAAESPVLVVGRRGCCMIHVVRRLLQGLGVNPAVCEIEEGAEESALVEELLAAEMAPDQMSRRRQMVFPAVFIGGRLVGGIDRLMAVHISGDLVPILKEAGALWL